MNDHAAYQELPSLSDAQIETLDQICKRASLVVDAPCGALFAAYDEIFKEKGLSVSRDNNLFRWLLRVGATARRRYRAGGTTNLVPYLRDILEAHGITVIDDDDNNAVEGVTRSLEDAQPLASEKKAQAKRRVSFDDARLEETWLSERSQFAEVSPQRPLPGDLRHRPRPARDYANTQRARSTSSSRRPVGGRHPAPKHYQEESPSTEYTSDHEYPQNPALLFQPSLTRLEQDAEAFLATSDFRSARQCLHHWHDRALIVKTQRSEAYAYASTQDRRKLLKESFDVWRAALGRRQDEQNRIRRLERLAGDFRLQQSRLLAAVALSHLEHEARLKALASKLVQQQRLEKKYFDLWHKLTVEEAAKVNGVLWRKCLRRWQDKVAWRATTSNHADVHRKERLKREYFERWLWSFRNRMAEAWHEQHTVQVTFASWLSTHTQHNLQEQQADDVHRQTLMKSAFRTLSMRTARHRPNVQNLPDRYDRKLLSQCMERLRIHAKLMPLAATLSLEVKLNLERKAFKTWHLRMTLTRQAAETDRKRNLQSTWTRWNDALRCKALAQRIDERVLTESLYNWMLQTRLQIFRRSQDARSLAHTLTTWRNRSQIQHEMLQQAEADFSERQRWRRMKFGMLRFNKALRNQEDAERAAVEFSNSRALPDVMEVWKEQSTRVRQLAKWAADARFYVLTTRTIKVWQERTVEHKHQRRRQAYIQVKTRVKSRMARDCFRRLHTKFGELNAMRMEAETRSQSRVLQLATQAFSFWRQKMTEYADLAMQAQIADYRKLLVSALAAIVNHHADLAAMEQQAERFKQESDLAVQGIALKRVQWAIFTARRRVESAEALQSRNRDQHVKQMLRHWSSLSSARQEARKPTKAQAEPESPSLRPASRAASRSRERPSLASSSPAQSTTPAYMRTPSRSRRTGRFRPLPTPAHVTPIAFDQSYLVTTPAPLLQAQPADVEDPIDLFEGLTPQITPFARKLRAGGVAGATAPPSALRSSVLGRSVTGGTSKSVRFASSSRFGSGTTKLNTTDEQMEPKQ